MCLIWVDVSFVHSSHVVHQLGGKLTHQSKLYVSGSTNLFDTFTHDVPRIRTTHCVDPAWGLVHTCRQNREHLSTDKVLRLFIDKLPVWTRNKMFQIMLDLFHNSLQTKSAICLQTITDFVYKCVLSLRSQCYNHATVPAKVHTLCKAELINKVPYAIYRERNVQQSENWSQMK